MRILTISHGYGVDERMKLLETLAEEHDVALLAPVRVQTQVFGELAAPRSATVEVISNPVRALGRGGHFVFRPRWREYRRLAPSVIHIEYDPWTPEFWSVVLPLTILHPRVPLVLLVKKNTRHIPRGPVGWVERVLTRLGMWRVKRVLAVSQKAASVFERLGYGSVPTEIQGHLPIDAEVFAPSPAARSREVVRVGFVGSIAPHKGIRELVAAVDLARERATKPVELELIGPICDDGLADLMSRHPWVTAEGPVPNSELPEALRTLDVFVMPSLILPDHEEHDGHALLEAMSMGLACVGSRSGIIPEIITEGENGWMVPPGDVNALCDVLVRLSDDASVRAFVSGPARETALSYVGLDTLVRARINSYEVVLNG